LLELDEPPDNGEDKLNGEPQLSELCKFGLIEQDADVIGLLWRECVYIDDEEEREQAIGKAYLIVAKNNNGDTGIVHFTYIPERTRFEESGLVTDLI
jgi:replicative DNA helicase